MKSNELRRLVRANLVQATGLADAKEVFYKRASADAVFPHIVFEIDSINNTDLSRHDYSIDVHVWTKDDEEHAENMVDAIEQKFYTVNDPQENILPTFFLDRTVLVDDPDRTLSHYVIRFVAQTYEI